MPAIDDIDTASVKPCPGCGELVRNMTAPVGGAGLDLVFAGPWYCDNCINIRCITARIKADRQREKS